MSGWIPEERLFHSIEIWPRQFENGVLQDRVLPVRPIWTGFIINTLVYAAIWFVLFFGFGVVKRTIRLKRGRCPRCGYDLRGNVTNGQDARSTGCPECGWNRAEARL